VEGRYPARQNVVVVQSGGVSAGLVVDCLLGEFQTVIKPLGKLFSKVGCISGSTILGNGSVALILDIHGLINTMTESEPQLLQ
jgi:two-component system chemotaxis sensor kinase CheA